MLFLAPQSRRTRFSCDGVKISAQRSGAAYSSTEMSANNKKKKGRENSHDRNRS
jgi:hypothetical protein